VISFRHRRVTEFSSEIHLGADLNVPPELALKPEMPHGPGAAAPAGEKSVSGIAVFRPEQMTTNPWRFAPADEYGYAILPV
jgi:hypothetical protein